eukprot:7028846-Prymnesium_polylepis.1
MPHARKAGSGRDAPVAATPPWRAQPPRPRLGARARPTRPAPPRLRRRARSRARAPRAPHA